MVGFLGQVSQVAAVDADAVALEGQPRLPHFPENPYGVGDAGIQHVVGVHQQDAGVGIQVGVGLKGGVLVGEAHDPAVGVGALHRRAEHLAGQHIGGPDAASDHGGPGAVNPRVRSLGPPEAELHDAVALGRVDHPGRLGGDKALMVQDIEDSRFHQLGLHHGRDHLDQRFPGEDHRPFGYGIDISGKMEAPQIFEEIRLEDAQAPQIVDIVRGKVQVTDILNDLF